MTESLSIQFAQIRVALRVPVCVRRCSPRFWGMQSELAGFINDHFRGRWMPKLTGHFRERKMAFRGDLSVSGCLNVSQVRWKVSAMCASILAL